ncbi:MAG: hypothetical protein ACFFDN_46955, partial [Candidatus Hodarchaeota archaeon]
MTSSIHSEKYDIYQALLEAGFTREEVDQKIASTVEEYNGFISKEHVLSLIVDFYELISPSEDYQKYEQEIDYDDYTINISEINKESHNFILLGKIERVYDVKDFVRKDGTPGRVGSFILNDGSSRIKVVLWNDHATIIESEFFKKKELIRIIGGYPKAGFNGQLEIHISKKGKVVLSPENVNLRRFPLLNSIEFSDSEEHLISSIKDLHIFTGFVDKIEGIIS